MPDNHYSHNLVSGATPDFPFSRRHPVYRPGKINLVDTHREGDWTLEAVTGHGLQRLQQIACVKERTAINGCIIQYSVVVYTAIRVCRRECASVRTSVRVHLAVVYVCTLKTFYMCIGTYMCVYRYRRMGPHRTGRAVHRARQVLPPGEALRRA